MAEHLLSHADLDVVRAAARGLGAIGVSSNKVMYALLDKLDHGKDRHHLAQNVSLSVPTWH